MCRKSTLATCHGLCVNVLLCRSWMQIYPNDWKNDAYYFKLLTIMIIHKYDWNIFCKCVKFQAHLKFSRSCLINILNSERYVVLGLVFFLSIWNKFDTLTLMYLMVFIFWILLFFLFCLENKRKFNKESFIHIYWQTLIFNSTQNPNFPFANVVHKKDYYILIYRTYDGLLRKHNTCTEL